MFMEEVQRPVGGLWTNPWAQHYVQKNFVSDVKKNRALLFNGINDVFNVYFVTYNLQKCEFDFIFYYETRVINRMLGCSTEIHAMQVLQLLVDYALLKTCS